MKKMLGIGFRVVLFLLMVSVFWGCAGFRGKVRREAFKTVRIEESRFVNVDGLRIHYYEISSTLSDDDSNYETPTVVLVHGWMGTAFDFSKIWNLFPPRFRVIAVDLPGFGLSDKKGFNYRINSFVLFLKDFTEQLDIRRFVLVGHSMGGTLSVFFTLSYPESVEKLILISPDGLKGEEGIWIFFGRLGVVTDLLAMLNSRFFMDIGVKFNVFYDASKVTKEFMNATYFTALTKDGRRAQLEITRNIVGRVFVDNLLRFIDMPVLIIWGKNDRVLPIKWAKKYREGLKNADLVILNRCGHIPMYEWPYRTVRYINRFLGE